jgi:long-chain fatty acid transport protein
MKNILMTASAVALGAGAAVAGGVERSTQSVAILFEKGSYAELSFGFASPDVSGTFGGAVSSGDMAGSYSTVSLGFKQALNETLDIALILDQPIGADVDYASGTGYPFAGSNATIKSAAVTGLLKYRFPSNVSVYGGVRAESVSGQVRINAPLLLINNYTLETETDYKLGYVAGVAWERPDIAARVALTYNSTITHEFDGTETVAGFPVPGPATFETEVPQSLNLEFQTGIAANTLLFGSVRWVEWSVFDVPAPALATNIVDYTDDTITYTLGVGRKFNDQWSGAVTLGYEAGDGLPTGNLGPTDGMTSIGIGATYTLNNMKITGGVRYVDIGDATTRTINGVFTDNSALAAGVKVGWTF